MLRDELEPESVATIAVVPPVVPLVIDIPVTPLPVEAFKVSTGFVAPLGPTVNAVAELLMMAVLPLSRTESRSASDEFAMAKARPVPVPVPVMASRAEGVVVPIPTFDAVDTSSVEVAVSVVPFAA
jgi:hypothetical protein